MRRRPNTPDPFAVEESTRGKAIAAAWPPGSCQCDQNRVSTGMTTTDVPARMTGGGVIELVFGVEAAQKSLEDVASPLSAASGS